MHHHLFCIRLQVDTVAAKKLAADLAHCFFISSPSMNCKLVREVSSLTTSPRLGQQYAGHMEHLNRNFQVGAQPKALQFTADFP